VTAITETATLIPTGTWTVDPAHSRVEFAVKHMGIATVRGNFATFEGKLAIGPDGAHASGTAETASINTDEPQRDAHLRSPDFFDAERFPEITFASTRIRHVKGPTFAVTGNLTIRDVTREVELEATVEGADTDPWGNERVGIRVRGSINRTDYGLKWQERLAGGGLLVGEEVGLRVDVSAVRTADQA
jgi:polyisoprenoid-binding protein YceI